MHNQQLILVNNSEKTQTLCISLVAHAELCGSFDFNYNIWQAISPYNILIADKVLN